MKKLKTSAYLWQEFFYAPDKMDIKGIYAGKPASFQFALLIFLVLGGTMLGGLLSIPVTGGMQTADAGRLRTVQGIASVCMFLLPAFGAAYLFSPRIRTYLSLGKMPEAPLIALTFLSVLLATPVIGVANILNQGMQLPSFLAPVEQWMRGQEDAMERVTRLLLDGKGTGVLLANLLVIAVIAGITEELMFRGALQRILGKWFRSHHAVIWSAAFLFSAFHLQFYGFIPRLLLGAYFGYLLYWSNNIWLPAAAHFFNNMCGVLTLSSPALSENKILSEHALLSDVWPVAAASLLLFVPCVLYLRKRLRSQVFLP